jgi:hypothetical protein
MPTPLDASLLDSTESDSSPKDPSLIPRTWWNVEKDDEGKVKSYKGFEIGMKMLIEESEKVGGFDGIIGFR